MNYNCPNCKSKNTQSVNIAHQSGMSNLSGFTGNIGVGMSSGRLGAGVSGGGFSGRQQTLLSHSMKPPDYKPSWMYTFGIYLSSITFFMFLFAVVWSIGGTLNVNFIYFILLIIILLAGSIGLIHFGNNKKRDEEYFKEIKNYNASFICLRCGYIFKP